MMVGSVVFLIFQCVLSIICLVLLSDRKKNLNMYGHMVINLRNFFLSVITFLKIFSLLIRRCNKEFSLNKKNFLTETFSTLAA